jgi:hypothetical protein
MTDEMPPDPFEKIEQMHGRVRQITPEMLQRRIVWDLVPCNQVAEVAAKIGLSGASPDVEEMEHHAAHERLGVVWGTIGPLIHNMAVLATRAVSATVDVSNGEEGYLGQEQEMFLHSVVAYASASIVAELQDMGMLQLTVRPVAL